MPSASAHIPVASAAADPPLDPPAVIARFHGFRVAPKTAFTVFGPNANSGVFVLPTMMAPAARSRCTTSASSSGTLSSKSLDPYVVRIPLVCVTSLMPTGTPKSAGSGAPRLSAAVARRASHSADSRARVTTALTDGFTASMRASTASITSSGEALRLRYSFASSTAGVNVRSRMGNPPRVLRYFPWHTKA